MTRIGFAFLALLLALGGCKSPQTPQQSGGIPGGPPVPSGPSTMPPSGIPSPMPTPGGMPSPGQVGMPTPGPQGMPRPGPQGMPKPGGETAGTETGGSSGKGKGSPAPSTGVGMPSPSIFPGGDDGEAARQRREARRQAGENLKKAGEKVWAKRKDIEPSHGTDKTGDARRERQADDDPLAPAARDSDLTPEDLARIRDAVEAAGDLMQTAGGQLAEAETDAEVAAVAEALGRARLAVLVAGHEIAEARAGNPGAEDALADLEAELEAAKVAVVVATRTAAGTLSLPETPRTAQEESELDKELNESIAIYEGQLKVVRREVQGGLPPGKSASEVPGAPGLGKGGAPGAGGTETSIQEAPDEAPGGGQSGGGKMPQEGGGQVASAGGAAAGAVPDDIPSAQGDDIVAQQLREAATAEQDPSLREKLWEEYRKYKEGL